MGYDGRGIKIRMSKEHATSHDGAVVAVVAFEVADDFSAALARALSLELDDEHTGVMGVPSERDVNKG